MLYPDFVGVGFQKSGTTTLYELLKRHPQVAICRDVKEPMYYRVPFMDIPGRGIAYYRKRYFGHLSEDDPRLKGEINAGLTFSGCEKKLSRDFPHDTKLIFMMRNPADRSYSAYKYFLARGFLPSKEVGYDVEHGHAGGFDHYVHEVLDDPRQRRHIMDKRMKYLVFSQSNYAACIEEYVKDFDLNHMRFVLFEEFVKEPHAVCQDIYEFLGVEDVPDLDYNMKCNPGNDRTESGFWSNVFWAVKGLNYFFYDLCYMTHWAPGFYKLFRKLYGKVRSKALMPETDKEKMLPETRAYLNAYYEEDIRRLEELTGRDLHEAWKIPAEDRRALSKKRAVSQDENTGRSEDEVRYEVS